jgi:hypothetical protein
MSTIAIVLSTLWLVTLANGYNLGGYIHLLPAIVIVGSGITFFRMWIRKRKTP